MDIGEKFQTSLHKWAIQHDNEELTYGLKQFIDYTTAFKDDIRSLATNALYSLVNQSVKSIYFELECVLNDCDSPIEVAFLLALKIAARESSIGTRISSDYWHGGENPADYEYGLLVEPQKTLGDYRVDFLLTLECAGPDFEHMVVSPNGMNIPGAKQVTSKIIVECDGHDFHEKTKAQAKSDKSRDRILQSVGYKVFRFTGSEIWNDCFNCAQQTIDALTFDCDYQIHGEVAYKWQKPPGTI